MTAVRQAFRQQAKACASLGSPLMERLMAGLADRLTPGDPVSDKVLAWRGDPSSKADSVPLRLAGGLHALVLSGQDRALAAAYSEPAADPTEEALAAIAEIGARGALPVVVGGIIPDDDAQWLLQNGVAAVFTPKDYDANAIMRSRPPWCCRKQRRRPSRPVRPRAPSWPT